MTARQAFRRRSWQRHPVLSGLRVACLVGIAVIAIVSIVAFDDDRPAWLGWLYPPLFLGWFVCSVLLVRRDEG